jgi:gamma-glutamyl:cysteine ligase YbdK (ATP-grasp superfamily)
MAVDRKTAEDAVVLQEWFAEQQMRIIGGATLQQGASRLKRLCDLLRETPDRELTLRDLQNSHGFPHAEVQRLAELAPSQLKLQNRQNPAGGRPSLVLTLTDNPT